MKIHFRHEAWGDEWQSDPNNFYDEKEAAEHLAEEYWSDDPSEPLHFLFDVEIKSERGIKRFHVTAESTVNFYASEKEVRGE